MFIFFQFRTRINKSGEMIVQNQDSRYQLNNLKNCLAQIRDFIHEAEKPPDRSKEERIAEMNNIEKSVVVLCHFSSFQGLDGAEYWRLITLNEYSMSQMPFLTDTNVLVTSSYL